MRAGKAPSDSNTVLAVWLQKEGTARLFSALREGKLLQPLPNNGGCKFGALSRTTTGLVSCLNSSLFLSL